MSRDVSKKPTRKFRPQTDEPLDITLIPYYAWDNRGLSEMTVWMSVQ